MIVQGRYRRGCGRAHFSSHAHAPFFGHDMVGTFNVATRTRIDKFPPTISGNGRRYWRLLINGRWAAWAFRWDGSKMSLLTWELISAEPLPDELKKNPILMEIRE